MNSSPTIIEYNTYLLKQCDDLLEKKDMQKDTIQWLFERTNTLIHALDISNKDKTKLLNKLNHHYSKEDTQLLVYKIYINMQIND